MYDAYDVAIGTNERSDLTLSDACLILRPDAVLLMNGVETYRNLSRLA